MTTTNAVSSPSRADVAWYALLLALLSVPGSTLAWDLAPAGGFYIGVPLAVAGVVLGRLARNRIGHTAVVIAGLMLALTAVWTLAGLVS
jgi:hypothetical protein